jgi:hypothetical protein
MPFFTGDPMMEPLANNGGNTLTHALLKGSPAIDNGDNTACLPTDQRGVIRPQGNGCDIGSFEHGLGGPTAVDDTITTTKNAAVLINALANDVGGDFGPPMLNSVGAAMSGTVVISETYILYTPNLNFTGTDIFSYTISDGQLTDTALITVIVADSIDKQTLLYLPFIVKPEDD